MTQGNTLATGGKALQAEVLPPGVLLLPASEVVTGLCRDVADMDLSSLAAREMAEQLLTEALLAIRLVNGVPAVPVRPCLVNHREARA